MAVSAYGSAMAGAGAPSAEKDKEKAEVSWRAYEEAGESAGRLVRKAVYGAAKVRSRRTLAVSAQAACARVKMSVPLLCAYR